MPAPFLVLRGLGYCPWSRVVGGRLRKSTPGASWSSHPMSGPSVPEWSIACGRGCAGNPQRFSIEDLLPFPGLLRPPLLPRGCFGMILSSSAVV